MPKYGSCALEMKQGSDDVQLQRNGRSFCIGLIDEEGMHGGAYIVARENIGQVAGLVAAAALFIDYIMTVAVSTASAVSQVYSVWPQLYDIRIEIALVSIALVTVANLRGLRESGNIFAVPTYLFVGMALL